MSGFIKKNKCTAVLVLVLLIQIMFLFMFGQQKQGYFVDETYSYGLSNSYYEPFLKSNEETFDNWIDENLFMEYITVQEGETFAYDSVYYNQTQDVHPPLYYMALHTVSSFFPNVFSKWFGLSINFIFFAVSGVFIFLISKKIFQNEWIALVPVIIYGISPIGLNNAMYIRMYMLMTMFTLINMYLHICLAEKWKIKTLVGISLCCILGFLTQYYYIFAALFVALFFCIFKLYKKQIKQCLCYVAAMIGSLVVSLLVYPSAINHMFFNEGFVTSETKSNMFNFSGFFSSLTQYLNRIFEELFVNPLLGKIAIAGLLIMSIIACAVWFVKYKKREDKERKHNIEKSTVLGCSALGVVVLTFLTVVQLSVITVTRYLSNIYPLVAILIVWLVYIIWKVLFKSPKVLFALLSCTVVFFMAIFTVVFTKGGIQYLYKDGLEKTEELNKYSSNYCLFLSDYYNAPITAKLPELCIYKSVYITPADNVNKMDDILDDKNIDEGIVLYIDTDEFWSSGYDAETELKRVKEKLKFTNHIQVGEEGLSVSYYLFN